MSTQWYFHTFRSDLANKLLGRATAAQIKKLTEVLTDPEEFGDLDGDGIESRKRAVSEVLGTGASYQNKSRSDVAETDLVVQMIFHRMGLAKAVGLKPVSPEPMSMTLAGELVRAAAVKRPGSPLQWLADGRRIGESKVSQCNYAVFDHGEVLRMRDDVAALIKDKTIAWKYPDVPEWTRKYVVPPLNAAAADEGLSLFAALT